MSSHLPVVVVNLVVDAVVVVNGGGVGNSVVVVAVVLVNGGGVGYVVVIVTVVVVNGGGVGYVVVFVHFPQDLGQLSVI